MREQVGNANCADRDYVSAFYRYTTSLLPYRKPAGDLLASAAVALLRDSMRTIPLLSSERSAKDPEA